ncbi:MAG: hypothetical protein QOH71_474 [Blastocatellia bacterium]|jgi:ribosomal protein L33|nr:hypothetical protein [Blastocatellia bacterium]
MISAAGKWLCGAFALVARDAARRFTGDRRNSSRRRSVWRPISLRWQRRRQRQVKLSAIGSLNRAPVVLLPQSHFHYTTHRNERTQHERVSGPVAATRLAATRAVGPVVLFPQSHLHYTTHRNERTQHERVSVAATRLAATRALVVHHWPGFHAHTFSLQTRPANRALRPFFVPENLRRNIEAGLIGPPRSPRAAGSHSITPPAVNRLRPREFQQTAELVRLGQWRKEQTPSFLMQSRSWHHWLQIFHSRPLTTETVPDRSRPNKASQIQSDLPEELVWRRAKRPATEVIEAERQQEVSASVQRPTLRTFQTQEATPKSAPIERPTAAQILSLDPGFLDRLTDDVIRRVEKRAQIERQRRGL